MYEITAREELVKQGYLTKSEMGDLVLYNYTDKTQYEKYWNPVTLNSRGIIFDKRTGRCVARPFPKFFNLNEHESTRKENLPFVGGYEAFEKMDGSLGIVFYYCNKWQVATRGTFYSVQATKAAELLTNYRLDNVAKHLTLLVEIIYPENRIVVNYGEQEHLTLLAVIAADTGEELQSDELAKFATFTGMPAARRNSLTLESLKTLCETLDANNEGFVLKFANGLRVKLKGREYLKVHKLKHCMGPLAVWEAMVEDKFHVYLQELPEELHDEANEIHQKLAAKYLKLLDEGTAYSAGLVSESIKENALYIKTCPAHLQGYLFSVMRGKRDLMVLLKQIRPTGNALD